MAEKKKGGGSASDLLSSFLPTSFGKQSKKKNVVEEFEKTRRRVEGEGDEIGPPIPPSLHSTSSSKRAKNNREAVSVAHDSDDDDDDDDLDGEADGYDNLPISHEIVLKDHFRTVSALSLDPSGSRLLTGGYDYEVKFWDFAGMDRSFKPFRSIEPSEGNQVRDLQYSITGDQFLVVTTSARAKLYDRNGFQLAEFSKGDPYIRDMRNTNGHVATLTSGAWDPFTKENFSTASMDSTIRIWDANYTQKQKQVIVVRSKKKVGQRVTVTAVGYSPDGKYIAGASTDGGICLWPVNGPYLRPSHEVEAHMVGTETSSILFSKNNYTMVTRGGDDTVKVFDIRNFKKPVSVATELPTVNPETNVVFSPDERLIVTGTAAPKGEDFGKLVMLNRDSMEIVQTMHITKSSVVKVLWHPGINQIVTGSADGSVHVFYDPSISVRGAKLCVVKEPKRRAVDEMEIQRPIFTPHALPMFRDEGQRSHKRKREKAAPAASKKPDSLTGHGRGGNLGTNETQHIMRALIKDTTREEDPREALLKYAKIAEEEPTWISKAYAHTQPKPVYAATTGEEEEEEEDESQEKKK
ncbi:uncharacterized protein VTP21DRAFT_10665 [Calcarisporiella thermophila]|uniref:uncharacterized protein n=1 Tax=Calcarisporiella thermophila TaxID=911321 RepID=UPI0037437359